MPQPQWISEVLHFCQGLPIILVGCKKDLRYDQKIIEELRKTSQKPVSPEEVNIPNNPNPGYIHAALGVHTYMHQALGNTKAALIQES